MKGDRQDNENVLDQTWERLSSVDLFRHQGALFIYSQRPWLADTGTESKKFDSASS